MKLVRAEFFLVCPLKWPNSKEVWIDMHSVYEAIKSDLKKVWFKDGALEDKSCLRNKLKISFGIYWVYLLGPFWEKDPTKKTFPTRTPT